MQLNWRFVGAMGLLAGSVANAQSVVVTHSVETGFPDPGSIACAAANPQRTTENSYYRSFDLTAFPQVTGPYNITLLEVGIENAVSLTGSQNLTINFWVDCDGGEPRVRDLELVETYTYELFDIGAFVEQIPVDVTVCEDATLVVEVFSEDFSGQPEAAVFFIGSNAAGQTAPGYIRTVSCGLNQITDLADPAVGGGQPDMHIMITALGEIVSSCDSPCASCPACACQFDTSTGNVCDIFDFLAFQTAFVAGDPCAVDINTSTGAGIGDIFDFLDFQTSFVSVGPCG